MKRRIDMIQREIIDDLVSLEDPFDQYSYLMLCGKELGSASEDIRRDVNLVPECQAQTWLVLREEDGMLFIEGDSEALVVKGAIYLLKELFDGRTADELAGFDFTLLDFPAFARHYTDAQLKGLHAIARRIVERRA